MSNTNKYLKLTYYKNLIVLIVNLFIIEWTSGTLCIIKKKSECVNVTCFKFTITINKKRIKKWRKKSRTEHRRSEEAEEGSGNSKTSAKSES